MSASERTKWRDEWISERHRTWGIDCPAVDIDFLLIEYTHAEPAALVEYKHESARRATMDASHKAIASLGNRAAIPVFGVRYGYEGKDPVFRVTAINEFAQGRVPLPKTKMTEREYVTLLYAVRGEPLPKGIFEEEIDF